MSKTAGASLIAGYDAGSFFDHMLDADARPRPHYRALYERDSPRSPCSGSKR